MKNQTLGLHFKNNRIASIAAWTLGGAAFGVFFGAVAAIFQGGPEVSRGIQETWWWFAVAGFLAATVGKKS
jgi:branched-subunit amino acid permease